MPADPPATLEMLDPDPQQPSGQPPDPRWERVIGLVLVIVLAGYGLVTWWSDSSRQSAYRAGLRAALDNDWDAALIAFGRADDYADAQVRANNAAIHVRERDTVYPIAAAAFAHRDWAALIPAVERLAKVAPTYRDTPRFAQTLETEVYTPALSDTVALRLQAQPPGWYVYRPGGWRYLDGSDVQSRLRARCPDGSWVLDLPGPPRAGTPVAVPGTLAARHLAVVARDGKTRTRLDALSLGGNSLYVCAGGRVWDLRPARGLPRVGNDIYPLFAYTAAYQTIGEPGIHVPVFPNAQWYVLDVAPGGDLLVVDIGAVQQSDRVRLYKTASDGSVPLLLGAFAGAPFLQFASPDARFALLMLQGTVPAVPAAANVDPPQQTSLILLDLTGARPPQTLAQVQRPAEYHPADPDLFGYFLTQPPYRGRILVSESVGTQQQIRLIDPAHPDTPQVFPPALRLYGSYRLSAGAEGGLLLGGLTEERDLLAPDLSQPVSATLVYLPPHGDPQSVAVPSAKDRDIVPFDLRAGQALYVEYPISSPASGPLPLTLYRLPLTSFGSSAGPDVLYAGELPSGAINDDSVLPFWLGAEWLAYVTPAGDLHVRRYDGTDDVLLDHGFGGFAARFLVDGSNP
jgi:hypothetical protein